MKQYRSAVMTFVRKTKIQNRLMAAFLVVSILPILAIGVYAYRVYTDSINEKLARSTRQAVTLINHNLLAQIQKYQELCGAISTDEVVQDNLPLWHGLDTIERRKVTVAADSLLNDKAPLLTYVNNVRILDDRREVVYDLGYDDIPMERYRELVEDVDARSPQDSLLYARTYRSANNIVLGRKIFNQYSASRHIGYVLISLDEKMFSRDIMGRIDLGTGSQLLILDGGGHVISNEGGDAALGQAYPDAALFRAVSSGKEGETGSKTETIDGRPSLITCIYDDSIDWYLISIVPESYINSETRSINENLILLAVSLLILCLVVISVIYKSIVGPVRKVNRYCRTVEGGGLDQKICDASPDEMGSLARSVDHMVGRIRLLMEQQNQDQKRQRELELNMLQSQINPHFLFNTLNTLKWIAVINQVPAVSDGISALSDLLRNTVVNKEEKISIREEIGNLNSYASIQKLRYANSFSMEYRADESLLNCRIPKFLLQPLVENAIIHGSYDNGGKIVIEVIVRRQDEDIIVEINDNGKGFDPKFQTDRGSRLSGIGISNVDERLKLYYGEKYGLTVASEPGNGTRCTVRLPKEN